MTDNIRIFHNPRCSKSRQTLALIEESGVEPTVIKYLETPPTPEELRDLLTKLDMPARDLLRKGEDAYKENNLSDPQLSDDALIEAMVKFPKLIERPIVAKGDKAIIGRPPERVNTLL
ncbi:arsenate reductase (glutaredoxin) [Teredinibacter turnerae T7901]|uniref:Arsenate reductase n=1 Tax=Teredinibacter turnerae (strain ATCC 39867 / T7901) TaxID=377629 RepID=C5BNZ5_TERTT|nr:arsenate reductase (glutaredoxin) [Teredinibacter turnerae]ACR12193.1 arsenate reductase (glutaredoxin) [Teredinibacter turnerae T7901]